MILSDFDGQTMIQSRIEVIDLDGGNRKAISLPEGTQADMPDWR